MDIGNGELAADHRRRVDNLTYFILTYFPLGTSAMPSVRSWRGVRPAGSFWARRPGWHSSGQRFWHSSGAAVLASAPYSLVLL